MGNRLKKSKYFKELESYDNYKRKRILYLSIISEIPKNFYIQKSTTSSPPSESSNNSFLNNLTQNLENLQNQENLSNITKNLNNIKDLFECENLSKIYYSKGLIILGSKELTELSEENIKNYLENFINSGTADSCVLYLSGYALKNGDFILVTREGEKYLKYEEIAKFWNNRTNKEKNKYLLIIIDSCYSGNWVEKNKNSFQFTEDIGIYVQSSCSKDERTTDTPDNGKRFTYSLTQFNLENYDNISSEETIKNTNPTSSGCYFKVLNEFGIKIMINSWSFFRNFLFLKEFNSEKNFYLGNILNNIKHGVGIYTWGDGVKYEGEFLEGKRTGFCREYDNNLRLIYEGEVKDNITHGRGEYYFCKGDTYSGNFMNGKRNGFGILRWANGEKYQGEWLDDKITGFGRLFDRNFKIKYIGEWFENKFNGIGRLFTDDGVYEGFFIENKKNGFGIFTWNNGDKYQGDWLEDKNTGIGIEYDINSNICYEGEWRENKFNGIGKKYFDDGYYEGGFINHKRNGFGVFMMITGNKKLGEWVNDKMQDI